MKKISILGSTGSIGKNALNIVRNHPDEFEVVALSAGKNINELAQQINEFKPSLASCQTEEGAAELKNKITSTKTEVTFKEPGAIEVAQHTEAQYVLSAMVGAAGLRPTLAAAQKGKTIALANKESMVVAGALVNQVAKQNNAVLLPVDSEHSAIFQCLQGGKIEEPKEVHKLILTASGGPFFLKEEINFDEVKPQDALKHPNWSMGAKITIDSATMMNKGLECIEAHWLFDVGANKIDVVVHPQSIVHSMVEFIDGSIVAQMGIPDMAGPIAYALSYPKRIGPVMDFVNFAKINQLTFFEPDHKRFPSIPLALKTLQESDTHPAVLNASNEIAVDAFLRKHIRFSDIFSINQRVVDAYEPQKAGELEDYLEADRWARDYALNLVKKGERL